MADIMDKLLDGQKWAEATLIEGMTSYTREMFKEAAAEILSLRAQLLAEREACAEIADHWTGSLWTESDNRIAGDIAAAIRAREGK
jgi:hypothetical protein